MKIKRTIYIPLACAGLGLLLGSALFWYLFFFSVVLIGLAYAWTVFSFKGLDIQTRDLPESIVAGEWFDEEILIRNSSRYARFGITIKQQTAATSENETWTDALPKESSTLWKSRVFCRQRGKYSLGIFTISVSDPFGFFTMSRTMGAPKDIIVYPGTIDLPLFKPEYSAGPEYFSRQRLMTRTSATISRVREYAEGDTLNHIHWPSTAHKGSLMVKVFETEPIKHYSGSVWLFLDMESSVHAGSGMQTTAELGIIITASLLRKYLTIGKKVGLAVTDDRNYLFQPATGEEHETALMKTLAGLQAQGTAAIDSLITQEMHNIEPNATVMIVTTTDSSLSVENLTAISHRNCMVIVIMVDASTYSPNAKSPLSAKPLTAAGIQVYTVRKDQDMNRALDSHRLSGTLFSTES